MCERHNSHFDLFIYSSRSPMLCDMAFDVFKCQRSTIISQTLVVTYINVSIVVTSDIYNCVDFSDV